MTGGLLQLKAYGSENVYLNANPQISFFRSTYRRHTNFAIENYQINFSGTPNLTDVSNTLFKFPIGRNADLLGPIYLVINLPAIYSNDHLKFQWIKNIGSQIIESATLFIGGNKIQELRGSTIHQHHRIRKNYSKNLNYNEMIGHKPELYSPKINNTNIYKSSIKGQNSPSIPSNELYIPLCFYFTENSGSYLPLIALQKSNVEIYVNLKNINDLYTIIDTDKSSSQYSKRIKPKDKNLFSEFITENNIRNAFNIYLDATYIFLDIDERKQFAELPHEYLIEQVQYASSLNFVDNIILDMKFFHPTKELLFYLTKSDINKINNWTNYGIIDNPQENLFYGDLDNYMYINSLVVNDLRNQVKENIWNNFESNILKSAKLLFDGIDRTIELTNTIFREIMSFQYHLGTTHYNFNENEFIYNYSFSLEPDVYQPSGTCNLTNLKLLQLQVLTNPPSFVRKFEIINCNIVVANIAYCISFRNTNYDFTNNDNIFNGNIQINSLIKKSLYGIINFKNIVIDNINYIIDETYGNIVNNLFDFNGSILKIFDDNWNQTDTYVITEGSLKFTYTNELNKEQYITDFINLQTDNSLINCYLNTLSDTLFNNYLSKIPNSGNYININKSIEYNLNSYVKNLLKDTKLNTGTWKLISFDTNNKKIYGLFTTSINQIDIIYNSVIPYSEIYNVYSEGNKKTYVAIIANKEIKLFTKDDDKPFSQPIILTNISLIIFSTFKKETNNNLITENNYLWNYNLYVEAINYNILRIVSGMGDIVYAG